MIRRSPDLMLLVIVITTVGAIATSIAHGAQFVDRKKSNDTYFQTSSWNVNSAYFDTFINSNLYASEDDQQQYSSLSLAVGKPKFEYFFQHVDLALGKPRYQYAITVQIGLTHQGTGFDLNMGEANLKVPLYKALNANHTERTSGYGFFGFQISW
ncbi:hypothetical protein MNBD_GAMMA16-1397 [hydrothermal vent metagenome]|uniref:Uncharacterized protein n=1 Tax=hydrothermal vent metagenome TaxID=652676 RepID=A0A3B0YS23_9ZZZZ